MRYTVLFELGREARRPRGGANAAGRELIAGYWMVEAPSPAEVQEWAGGAAVEIRRVFEADDVRAAN